MREFKDDAGRSWNIHLSCASLKRVAAKAGFDLADFSNGKAVELFGGTTTHLADVLWALVESQAQGRQIDETSFGEALRGDCLSDAVAVLKEELLSFFPSQRRKLMQKLLAKMDTVVEQMAAKAEVAIENLQPPSESGGSLPIAVLESSASAPTSGLSAS
jgi:hypothetical protein